MSEFKVEVVPVTLEPHPNADQLSIVHVYGFPVVVRTEDFRGIDRAAYLPVDSLAGPDPRFDFLGTDRRIRARRFRGVYSEGLLIPPRPSDKWDLGSDIQSDLGVVKYDPPDSPHRYHNSKGIATDCIPEPPWFHRYTDIENLRRYPDILRIGEPIHIVEKIHGTNARFCYHDGQLWVGSHRTVKKLDYNSVYWQAAKKFDLENKLRHYPGWIFFGEVYGPVQKLTYGRKTPWLSFFDISTGPWCYLPWDSTKKVLKQLDLPAAPDRYSYWLGLSYLEPDIEVPSALGPNISEGVVVRPVVERRDDRCGRVIFKLISKQYQLQK